MFESVESLEADLSHFSNGSFVLPQPFRLGNSEVGKAIIQLAGGKTPGALSHLAEGDANLRSELQKVASKFVANVMLSPASNHFTTLGVAPDFEPSTLRDNFRRLMALVHPDARPIGFPDDAASRVNRAYAVLADEHTRETYTALESGAVPAGQLAPIPAATRNESRVRSSAEKPTRNKFVGWATALRARQSLLWLAALLLVPLGMSVMSLFSTNEPQRLVEARPRLVPSLDMQSPVDDANDPITAREGSSVPSSAVDRVAAVAVVKSLPARPERIAPRESIPAGGALPSETPSTVSQPHPAMTAQLSAKSIEISSRRLAKQSESLAPSPSVAAVDTPARVKAPSESDATLRSQDSSTQPPIQPSAPTVAVLPNGGAGLAMTTPSPVTTQRTAATTDRNDIGQKTKSTDADEMIVRFSNAYESGSISAFSQLMAPSMTGRRQMLNDYERVFQATRQRSIKFKQLKHAINGERISTTGYATVTTVDQENRTVIQRIYLEFEIGRDRGEPSIERLANYVIN